MPKRPRQDIAVGAMFSLALVVLALGIMAVGGESRLFEESVGYRVRLTNAEGLQKGSPVKMAGVEIGSVSSIRLPTATDQRGIEVEIAVDPAYAGRVRQDSTASLRILLLVSGEKYIEITPGAHEGKPLPPGSLIPQAKESELLEQGQAIAENLNDITVTLKNILSSLDRGEGLIGKMFKDPQFGEEGLESLRVTLDNLEEITGDLKQGRGPLGKLLYDEATATRLQRGIEHFAQLLEAVNRQEGALGDLLRADGKSNQALSEFREAAAALKHVSHQLESQQGLIGRLLNDVEYSESVAQELRLAIADLNKIIAKINRGEGTLGALVNDRALYEAAEDVVAGVDDSKFTRWLLRHYRKKGVKAQERRQEPGQAAPVPQPDQQPEAPEQQSGGP